MPLSLNKPMAAGLALAALLAGGYAGPAHADVKAGVDAWSQGDYAGAVREWEAPAAAGDPDALFNLAQAYRLGRGVPTDPARAEALYARAAADGHLQAADIYGLMLFEQGRREQALYTDQDNGIIFEASNQEEANAIRQKLLPLAREVNVALDDCGFVLCRGNIMAGNAELCLSTREWENRFDKMIREASPQNMTYKGIFFDIRSIWGDENLAVQLQRKVLEKARMDNAFQRIMADSALQNRPPLGGLFRNFTLASKGAEKDTLDLKVKGLAPITEGVRVLALSQGIEASNTLERIRQLVGRGIIERLDGDAYIEAYQFIQLLRMQQHQLQAEQGMAYSNRIYPDELNTLDRRILRESFRQAQRLQSSLAFRYQL